MKSGQASDNKETFELATPSPDVARSSLREIARATEQVLEGPASNEEILARILNNQLYIINVMRWLVSREQERLREEKE